MITYTYQSKSKKFVFEKDGVYFALLAEQLDEMAKAVIAAQKEAKCSGKVENFFIRLVSTLFAHLKGRK